MKFVDEVTIRVEAGKGGDGALSFRREKFVPRGGPDGGDGGDGGSVVFSGDKDLNTLADFRHVRVFRAPDGEHGKSRNQTGRSGEDLLIPVPLGTRVCDAHTGELIGEITREGERLEVARGGRGGLGNARFKSSVNRAPRKTTPGKPGEARDLFLELQVLADVGLLGLPNAGKSTFLRAVSDARPKVAEYPFTTLHPHLGVVRVERLRSFVIADIPGLIAGAAEGAGLGIQFLRHLKRTHLLLHLVDMAAEDPAADVRTIERELAKFSLELAARERWLVLNKMDLVPAAQRNERVRAFIAALGWKGPVYAISAIRAEGCRELADALMRRLEERRTQEKPSDVIEHA